MPLKGGHLAVRAIAGLPDWRLVVCGDGPDEAKLRAEAAALGIADRVEFRGWRQRDEVLRAMADEADVLLFPSLHDEAGLAVAEAAAIGLPIVCLDRGGPPVIAGQRRRARLRGTDRGAPPRRTALCPRQSAGPGPARPGHAVGAN